jgi:arylsulfatase A-like enzyme
MPHQPNILLFISDQQRTDTLGCYGNNWIQSPHQDALAERSFLFENTYVTQAVCTPARGSLMTGLYPHTHGCVVNRIKLRDDIPSIAEMLPDTYRKAHFGKWHLGDDSVRQHGFDEWVSAEDDHRNMYTKPGLPFSSYYHWMKDEQGIEPEDNSATGEIIFSPRQRSKQAPEHQMAASVKTPTGPGSSSSAPSNRTLL